eukprot:6191576-Pleurochrysis_carterae.AAC.2
MTVRSALYFIFDLLVVSRCEPSRRAKCRSRCTALALNNTTTHGDICSYASGHASSPPLPVAVAAALDLSEASQRAASMPSGRPRTILTVDFPDRCVRIWLYRSKLEYIPRWVLVISLNIGGNSNQALGKICLRPVGLNTRYYTHYSAAPPAGIVEPEKISRTPFDFAQNPVKIQVARG